VRIVTRPLWQLRLARALPRYLLYGVCFAGLLASARFAIAPPRQHSPARSAAPAPPPDLAAEGYAALFARRYLTWDAAHPQLSEQLLAPMTGSAIDPDAGLSLPAGGQQHVLWAEVVQARRLGAGRHVYTVAAQTDTAGLVYLTVGVARRADGALTLIGYPAFVGAPAAAPAQTFGRPVEVTDGALATVVERAMRNYLAASSGELAADLSPGARISLPSVGLTLDSTQRLSWAPDRRSVVAFVEAEDSRGARYTLAYELDVAELDGRWEVSAIQMDPDS
jgi:Conjugative transposon protein TcpC